MNVQSRRDGEAAPPPALNQAMTGNGPMLSTRHGPVPLVPERQIEFRGGLPGFPGLEWFQLNPLPRQGSDLLLLQSIDVMEAAFLVMPLSGAGSFIALEDTSAVCRELAIDADDLLLMVIVSVHRGANGIETFVNLRAPLFIDVRRRLGAQIVLHDNRYPLRFKINGEMPSAAA